MRLWMNVLSFNRPRATFHFGFSDNRTHTCSMQHNGQHCWPGRTTRSTTAPSYRAHDADDSLRGLSIAAQHSELFLRDGQHTIGQRRGFHGLCIDR